MTEPEQLVERLRVAAPFQNDPSNESLMLDAAAALSECREALRHYGKHYVTCPAFTLKDPPSNECTCGLDDALAAQPPSESSEPPVCPVPGHGPMVMTESGWACKHHEPSEASERSGT